MLPAGTAKITFTKPNWRFYFDYLTFKFDTGIKIVPEHIFKNEADWTKFAFFDLEKGWPLSTGPYVLNKITPNEVIWVRNDNWWAAKTGLKKLPGPKRIVKSFAGAEEVRVATAADNGFDIMEDITLSSFEALKAKNKNWQPFQPNGWAGTFAGADDSFRVPGVPCVFTPSNCRDSGRIGLGLGVFPGAATAQVGFDDGGIALDFDRFSFCNLSPIIQDGD